MLLGHVVPFAAAVGLLAGDRPRVVLAWAMLGLCLTCSGQTEWRHEKLLENVRYGLANHWNADVSPSGIPTYIVETDETVFLHAWRGRTDLNRMYLPDPSAARAVSINSSGQVAYTALTLDSVHIMVDGHDYFADLYDPDPEADVEVRHIDDLGRPLWIRRFGLDTGQRLFRGTEELSPGLMGLIEMWDMNRRGDALWTGWTLEDGSSVEDFYLNKTNVTKPALGSNRSVRGAALNEQGDVLFAGKGDNTGGVWHLFLNDRNLTEGWLTGQTGVKAKRLSDDGHMLWLLSRDGPWRLMLDSEDISTPVFGDHEYALPGGMRYISNGGVVGWLGHDNTLGRSVAFRNQEDISTPVVGSPGGAAGVWGMDDWGNVLWYGQGVLTGGKRDVFVNSFNLSRDAMPDGDYRSSYALAIGPNGHVLWYSSHGPRNSTIWLSTPVPEPPAILLGAPVLFLVRRRRR